MTQMEHSPADATRNDESDVHAGHRGHSWMMIACCIPMLIIVGVLVATHVVSAGFLIYAMACLGMMFAMMKMMDHGGMKM